MQQRIYTIILEIWVNTIHFAQVPELTLMSGFMKVKVDLEYAAHYTHKFKALQ